MEITNRIDTLEQLTAMFPEASGRALDKERSALDTAMAEFVDRSSFGLLATSDGNGSVDVSPRGGPPGFIRRLDDRHVAIPDLNGNNRLDSYRNLVVHPFAGLLLLVPGVDETLRINGPAMLTTDPDVLSGFTKELRPPKLALVVETAEVFGHCAKAFRRGQVWSPDTWPGRDDAPDLARMYATAFGYGEGELRDALEQSYEHDLAED
jgi:PPOX class probable FMN-dependent enzyme